MNKRFSTKDWRTRLLVLLVCGGALLSAGRALAHAQSRPQRADGAVSATQGNMPGASALYEEAAEYSRKKFDEFARTRVPYDQNLANKTLQEQRDLALRHAATLAARGPLKGTDIFYLGKLYALAERREGAIEAMRRFIAEAKEASVENLQEARRVLIMESAKLNLRDEAEKMLEEYVRVAAPPKAQDRYVLENVVAGAFYKMKQYERAAPHALEAFRAAKLVHEKNDEPRRRDEIIFNAGHLLADIYTKAGRRGEAVAAMNEVRALGLAYPSAFLYAKAANVLARYGEKVDAVQPVAASAARVVAPDLVVAEWIDRTPAKMSDLRGRVVLLDFWATWCGPCVVTIPKLNSLQKKYGESGLVVVGLTDFQGGAEGRQMTPAEELVYLRQFKKRFSVVYGFGVADREDNSRNYGVTSLPTAALIDRQGRVRHFIVGVYEGSDAELTAAVKKLLDEPANQ